MLDQLEIFTESRDGALRGNHYVIKSVDNAAQGATQYQFRMTVEHSQAGETIIEERHVRQKTDSVDKIIDCGTAFDLVDRDFWEGGDRTKYALVQAWSLPNKPDFDTTVSGSNLVLRINRGSNDIKSK